MTNFTGGSMWGSEIVGGGWFFRSSWGSFFVGRGSKGSAGPGGWCANLRVVVPQGGRGVP